MKKNTILVCGDIHGRKFWKEPCSDIGDYEKVVFLGDYLDPYDFENISVQDSINNFIEIIDFKKENKDKVILLIGNHDLPYFSKDYYNLSRYHCRHSEKYHSTISRQFEENRDLFQLAYVYNEQTLSLKKEYNDILFTHAGVESGWLEYVVNCDETDVNKIADVINGLLNSEIGMRKLYCVTPRRGGNDRYGSCVWADVNDMLSDISDAKENYTDIKPIHSIKQVFGHTLQAYYLSGSTYGKMEIGYGEPWEFYNCKMVDTTKAYILDVENFSTEVIKN